MQIKALFGSLFLSVALVSGCSSAGGKAQTAAPAGKSDASYTQTDFDRALAAAEEARTKADSVGGEWRDTRLLIKEAQELAAKGEFAQATKLADTARMQSEIGYQQAMSQADAGPRFGPTGSETMTLKSEFDRAMAAARAGQKKAQSVDSEWRDTAAMMKEAEQLASEGKYAEAIALAKQAAQQSAMAYYQGSSQQNAGPRF